MWSIDSITDANQTDQLDTTKANGHCWALKIKVIFRRLLSALVAIFPLKLTWATHKADVFTCICMEPFQCDQKHIFLNNNMEFNLCNPRIVFGSNEWSPLNWDYDKHKLIWRLGCQKQVSRAGTSNYIPQYLWDLITCPWPWNLLLIHKHLI